METGTKSTKYVSANAPDEVFTRLKELGCTAVPTEPVPGMDTPVSSHADIRMCRLGCRDDSPVFFADDEALGSLGSVYPADIPFNAACTGSFFIHSLRHTYPGLLARAEELGMTLLDVRQGYTKCSTVIVDEDSVITYDKGIQAVCAKAGMNVLLVRPGYVSLSGYDTGLIGGASGRVGDTILFCGDITKHPDGEAIIEWIRARGLRCEWTAGPLTDIGSII